MSKQFATGLAFVLIVLALVIISATDEEFSCVSAMDPGLKVQMSESERRKCDERRQPVTENR